MRGLFTGRRLLDPNGTWPDTAGQRSGSSSSTRAKRFFAGVMRPGKWGGTAVSAARPASAPQPEKLSRREVPEMSGRPDYPLAGRSTVSPPPDFPAAEAEVLAYWKADKTFQASVDARPAGPNGS